MNQLDSVVQRLERIDGSTVEMRPRFDVEPLPMVAPRSIEAVIELMRFAARDKLRVIPFGLGSKLGWCGIPGHVDFMVSTRRLTRVVSHVPDDGTITVEAGMTMAALKERCRSGGHFLTPDVARAEHKTIGGVIAASESGFDRARFGPARHHVLGLKVVLADGTLARTGGQLVKNVTGFDLHRLYCGSHGTLCVIVEASLRLFPEPEHEVWLSTGAANDAEAFELVRQTMKLPTRLVSLVLAEIRPARAGQRWALSARLFGRREPVEAERTMVANIWPKHSSCEGERARTFAAEMNSACTFAGSELPVLHATCLPSRAMATVQRLTQLFDDAQIERRLALQPATAEIHVEVRTPLAADKLADFVRRARKSLQSLDATLAVRNAPRAALLDLAPFGEPGAGLELMRALQSKLDPLGVFATGRFHGGL